MLDTYNTAYLKCRTFGHSWEEFVPVGKRPGIGFRFSLLCTSCGMERHDNVGTSGILISRQYVQPEGYSLEFRVDRAEARRVYHERKRKVYRRGTLTKRVS